MHKHKQFLVKDYYLHFQHKNYQICHLRKFHMTLPRENCKIWQIRENFQFVKFSTKFYKECVTPAACDYLDLNFKTLHACEEALEIFVYTFLIEKLETRENQSSQCESALFLRQLSGKSSLYQTMGYRAMVFIVLCTP